MFFIMGVTPGRKPLPFSQQGICPVCGRMARFEIRMDCYCLTLFFLPVFRFRKRYFLTSTCCGAACELPAGLGKAAERGEADSIDPLAMHFTAGTPQPKRCPACGFEADPSFQFCPKCGARL